ncbi:LysR family transcriptional regulator [Brucella pseudogrignonensis]|uniref:DNA-binding transcriptional LysR family regulator n=1 Tax=Brucella pseudogrignonensis TaxID=419475 RepID=A0ABU1MF14_9HYPH|nr:LysR family transcriptional regulator [Brucella pseudogrignonensis]MDR6434472.1 DNA-binding transcriptional LysR family regulator [Brucella pseudogrignonensis]
MQQMNNLRNVDLNLLVILDVLLTERHVSRAAVRLNMSQPAVSHALARLRELLDDPLLIREGAGLVPSIKAMEIAKPLTEALSGVRAVLGPQGFDPATTQHRFHLSMSDYGGGIVLPGLVRELRKDAPGIDLAISQFSREGMIARVLDGEIDLGFGVFPHLPAQIAADIIMQDEYVCLLDKRSLEGRAFDAEIYFSRPHALVAVRGDATTEIEESLKLEGQTRHIAVVVPHWGVAPHLIAGTDLILTIARGGLKNLPPDDNLIVMPVPVKLPPIPFVQIWHKRRESDPAHRWLRSKISSTDFNA